MHYFTTLQNCSGGGGGRNKILEREVNKSIGRHRKFHRFIKTLAPLISPMGNDPGNRINTPFDMLYILFVRTDKKFGLKIFEIDSVIEI